MLLYVKVLEVKKIYMGNATYNAKVSALKETMAHFDTEKKLKVT